ncbi:MAG: FAD-dependent oxidoreductase [Paracoccaceae bacterium]|nr:FAD-dependent oxidoreductase [Paracoccaceae bacterium]
MTDTKIAIIGAGVAGLVAARALADRGRPAAVFDKGRRPGGRLATRRTREGPVFDHGAQFVTARAPGFVACLEAAARTGRAAVWDGLGGHPRYVGVPDMAALAAHLGGPVAVASGVEVTGLRTAAGGWRVRFGGEERHFDRVVLALPAPQAARLLGDHPLAARLDTVRIDPCLTLMAAFAGGPPPPFAFREPEDGDLASIAHDGGKPGRGGAATWVAHGSPAWSAAHLEAEREEIASLLLPKLAAAIGRAPREAALVRGHRWRFARVAQPLGEPFLADAARSLFLGGDWCLGPSVEAAWASGRAIAEALIGRPG